jgi:hypothetical protein
VRRALVVLLGLGACEDPDPIGAAGESSRGRSDGTCFAEVLWDGDAWTLEISRDAEGRLLSAVWDHGGYLDVTEVSWSGEVAVHHAWRERPDGSVIIDRGEVIERYAGGRIVSRGDQEVWSWSAEGFPERYWRVDHEGEHEFRGSWTVDGRPASASWSAPGAYNETHETWDWHARGLLRYTRGSSATNSTTLEWRDFDGLGRPTRGEVLTATFEGSSTRPARWEWRKGRAVERDLGGGPTTFRWSGSRLIAADEADRSITWVWDDDRVVARGSDTWTWDDEGWLVAATWDAYTDGEATYSGECQRWSEDFAPLPAMGPAPRPVPGPIDVQPPGLFEAFDP